MPHFVSGCVGNREARGVIVMHLHRRTEAALGDQTDMPAQRAHMIADAAKVLGKLSRRAVEETGQVIWLVRSNERSNGSGWGRWLFRWCVPRDVWVRPSVRVGGATSEARRAV
eukprot:GHVU01152537.1.p1 GENE.GHVU01152537.1~~GHVU01152537.1.p1  ORF type:complete len:113 (-),score=2.29 GHVU01152537.1:432-770(-)